jgi:hypothetical protein
MASVNVYDDLSINMYADMYADGWSSVVSEHRIGMRSISDGRLFTLDWNKFVGWYQLRHHEYSTGYFCSWN